jgi:redox-sensitive bicupin YhaK (pirin superfamily)
VRSLFSYGDHGRALSPFLLLDHAGPHQFTPTTAAAASAPTRTGASRP